MQISIPKIVKRLELKGYAEEFGEAYLEAWVNPPVGMLERLRQSTLRVGQIEIPQRKLEPEEKAHLEVEINEIIEEQLALYAELLSQGGDGTRMKADELREMVTQTSETDPMFWMWLKNRIIELINAHRLSAKKG